ncbi:unnamed protein product [Lymnaea stagnalis]|uniref:Ricin B lectin domain-containing protein n=1 Tax=Lymnaea stagnalis TaxID=6523 RepID=A0AAV2GXG8_LYMST
MNYNWIRPPPPPDGVERKTWADPIKTPTHLGCCFAVSKKNFDRLGRYDPGLDIWGCENLELSFKTWMCGGRVELIPCSHVGHMYRPSFPYSWGSDGQFTLQRNCLRVADVWLDEYKKVYHERISDLQKSLDIGDTRDRKAIRDRLQCRPFEWYAKEIYPELYIPLNTSTTGRIASAVDPALCLSRDVHWPSLNQSVLVTSCNSQDQKQHFFLSKEGHIRRDQGCLVYDRETNQVVMRYCEHADGHWIYTPDDTLMAQEVGQCITLSPDKKKVFIAACNANNPSQKWKWPRKSVVFQAR